MRLRLLLLISLVAFAAIIVVNQPLQAQAPACNTIQSGLVRAVDGTTIETGFDSWGYNYQAMSFNGKYCDYDRKGLTCTPDSSNLEMKWNEAWLGKTDCDGNGLLDRHFDTPTYRGSGAWLTNHERKQYFDSRGKKQHQTYFVKIIAVPLDAMLSNGIWYVWDNQAQALVTLGPQIWGDFAITMEVVNDTGTGEHGALYVNPRAVGFGSFGPH